MTREEFRAILVANDACSHGLADYDAASDADVAPFLGWSTASQLAAIQGPLRKYIGWGWAAGVLPMWAMRRANLARANLAWADLRGADLTGANLTRANLARANLAWADLRGADLRGADLAGADLTGAIMPNGWEAVVAYRPDGSRGGV